MLQRLELFGRFEFDHFHSGIDSSDIYQDCVVPFLDASKEDQDGFLVDLRALVADDHGGFATFGAARLVWELYVDVLKIPAALPLIDAAIEFKRARGLPSASLTGYEVDRLFQRDETFDLRKW
jgi:hypothetical protein